MISHKMQAEQNSVEVDASQYVLYLMFHSKTQHM